MAQFINFGTGREGSLNISAANLGGVPGFGAATVTGTAGQSSCVKSDWGYFNTVNGGRDGDMVMIHQSQGTGAGQWEVNYIVSTSGTTVNLLYPLTYTYVAGAQMYTSPQLYNGTVSGNLGAYSSWDGTRGGVIFLVDKGTLTISGSISVSGSGFRGCPRPGVNGSGGQPGNSGGYGENFMSVYGGGGVYDGNATSPVGNGGGGSAAQSNPRGLNDASGGGGNGTAGGNGGGGSGGAGGGVSGNESLTTMVFGGGSGAVGGFSEVTGNDGSNGGGIILIISKKLIVSGLINANGVNGQLTGGSYGGGAGGGAGGSILVKCQIADFGSNILTAIGGTGATRNSSMGGNGGAGRIRVEYADSISGSTSPTASTAQVTTLKSQVYSGMI